MLIRKFTYRTIAWLLFAGTALAGCMRDDVDSGRDKSTLDPDFTLSLDFSLDSYGGSGTRAGHITRVNFHPEDVDLDRWESYIDLYGEHRDPKGNPYAFYILMFDTDNNFLYNPSTNPDLFYITNLGMNATGSESRWRVIFQVPEEVRNYIKVNDFKIAVFANWPTAPVENEHTGESRDPMPAEFLSDKMGDGTVSIHRLDHCVYDYTYGGEYFDVYNILTDSPEKAGGNMGPFTDWILSYYDNEDAAVEFIRGKCPDNLGYTRDDYEEIFKSKKEDQDDHSVTEGDVIDNPRIFHRNFDIEFTTDKRVFTYENVWRLWNFGGEANRGKTIGGKLMYDASASYENWWVERNEERLQLAKQKASENFTYATTNETVEAGALEFINTSGSVTFGTDAEGRGYIQLPAGSVDLTVSDNYTGIIRNQKNCLHFKALADAIVIIKTDDISKINIETSVYHFYMPGNDTEPDADTWFLDVPNDATDVYIFSKNGDGKIYEIETIQKKYLYDSDRRTLLPSMHQLIPMYGIQEFSAVGDYWIPGNIFDLSHENGFNRPGYPYKPIYLLRSVAKVELLISKEFERDFYDKTQNEGIEYRPRLIMRSMNREARCMPLDTSTPTELIWADVDQEILDIRAHGPFYEKDVDDVNLFRDKLAWYFQTWVDLWGWDWNQTSPAVQYVPVISSIRPPHVYNAKINRADYVRFIKISEDDEFDRYVFYMPEKAIDDPNLAGNLSEAPKVPHVEVRLRGESVSNLDDDEHNRIYFMDYATAGANAPTGNYSNYEKSRENLMNHWPIMRNHVYRFRVFPNGDQAQDIRVTLTVAGAASREVSDIPPFE